MINLFELKTLISSLSVYSALKDDLLIKKFVSMITHIENKDSIESVVEDWAAMVNHLYKERLNADWSQYIYSLIYCADNYFSREISKGNFETIDKHIKNAAFNDMDVLLNLSKVPCHDFKKFIHSNYPSCKDLIDSLPEFDSMDFHPSEMEHIMSWYEEGGVGIFCSYSAFKYTNDCVIEPIKNFDSVSFFDLKQYKREQNVLIENTLGFLKNKPYNNVLLYGDRGTGKSSTVKAILSQYHKEGLRAIQVYKENLVHLDKLMSAIKDVPLKFIIFIDDLTFNDVDDNFSALKAVLEGSLAKQPDNIVIYATTNRRHLVRESFSAREGNEVHLGDTIDETVSLSDRFGITITFTAPNKDNFLQIVKEIADDRKLEVPDETLFSGAEKFALSKGNRSPRLARQYVDYLQGRLELDLSIQ